MGKSLVALRDNQVVQGEILNRVELALERNTEAIARNSEAIAQNSEASARHSEAIARLADGFLLLQSAMKGLTETVDRFIRGLEHNGNRGGSWPVIWSPDGPVRLENPAVT
jgi:hypothetical protein